MKRSAPFAFLLLSASFASAALPALKVRPQVIDAQIKIGYGLAIADVDGDGRSDILLADARQVVWYRAPKWEKFVMAENLTEKDNVCIAARDLDGDGKAEVAVGAEWNPNDTLTRWSFIAEPRPSIPPAPIGPRAVSSSMNPSIKATDSRRLISWEWGMTRWLPVGVVLGRATAWVSGCTFRPIRRAASGARMVWSTTTRWPART